jgi:hypothetical protein
MNGKKKLTIIMKPFKGKGECETTNGRPIASQRASV